MRVALEPQEFYFFIRKPVFFFNLRKAKSEDLWALDDQRVVTGFQVSGWGGHESRGSFVFVPCRPLSLWLSCAPRFSCLAFVFPLFSFPWGRVVVQVEQFSARSLQRGEYGCDSNGGWADAANGGMCVSVKMFFLSIRRVFEFCVLCVWQLPLVFPSSTCASPWRRDCGRRFCSGQARD
jgi:hypothetical protein